MRARAIDLDAELARFRDDLPIEEAATPPSSWYTSAEFFEREKETVFARAWHYACPLDRVAHPGDYVRVDFHGESYLIVRDERGELRGFHNVCRHHAAQLLEGEGRVERIVCPYHGWTYALDGALKSAPGMGAMRNFARASLAM